MFLTSRSTRFVSGISAALVAGFALSSPASAELTVSQLVVELDTKSRSTDVEVINDSAERSYVSIEPRRIVDPGTPGETSSISPDPEELGLLVSPRRVVLEPGQRRIVRIADIGRDHGFERVYRVTVKPVVGEVSGEGSGLKLLVGYDLLVLARPDTARSEIKLDRQGDEVVVTNRGNSSVELADGNACDPGNNICARLPGKRLYAGASWRYPVKSGAKGSIRVRSASGWSNLEL